MVFAEHLFYTKYYSWINLDILPFSIIRCCHGLVAVVHDHVVIVVIIPITNQIISTSHLHVALILNQCIVVNKLAMIVLFVV